MKISHDMLDRQVKEYRAEYPVYDRIQQVLRDTLTPLAQAIDPAAVVTARPKSIASFAGKLIRKQKYVSPLTEMTDLCGARIVCTFESQVQAVCDSIRERLGRAIVESDSLDHRSRLRVGEFGYRSVHYVIQLRQEEHWVGLTDKMCGRKIEIQVRTRLQDIWSDLGHDRVYKGSHSLPQTLMREVARIAAHFEGLDEEFERVVALIEDYRAHFGAFLDEPGLDDERNLQEVLRRYDQGNPAVPLRQAELAILRDAWPEAIARIRSFQEDAGALTPELEATLGFALCRQHPENRERAEYKTGLALLESATRRAPRMLLGWIRRAECIGSADEAMTRICYHNAYRIDPADPAALAGYLRWQLEKTTSTGFVEILRPAILEAIARCERQAAVRIDLPWAYFRAAFFRLVLIVCPKPEHKAGQEKVEVLAENKNTEKELMSAVLKNYANAVAYCRRNVSPIEEALQMALHLQQAELRRQEVDIVVLFLKLAASRIRAELTSESLQQLVQPLASPESLPVDLGRRVMIVSGTSRESLIPDRRMFERIIRFTLQDYCGPVFFGGTEQGVPGMVGRIASRSRERLTLIGYMPNRMSSTGSSSPDPHCHCPRFTDGEYFSQMEPLQEWIDILSAGVRPEDVTLLGLGGGRIAAFEYRLALLMGARVGIITGSGREADELASDPVWQSSPWRLWRIPIACADQATMRCFMHPGQPLPGLDSPSLGRRIHECYVEDNIANRIDVLTRIERLAELEPWITSYSENNRGGALELGAIYLHRGTSLWNRSVAAGMVRRDRRLTADTLAELEDGEWMDYWNQAEDSLAKAGIPQEMANLHRRIAESYLERLRLLDALLQSSAAAEAPGDFFRSMAVDPKTAQNDEDSGAFYSRQIPQARPVGPSLASREQQREHVRRMALRFCDSGASWAKRAVEEYESIEALVPAAETLEMLAEIGRRWVGHVPDEDRKQQAVVWQEKLFRHPVVQARPDQRDNCLLTLIYLLEAQQRADEVERLLGEAASDVAEFALRKAYARAERLLRDPASVENNTVEEDRRYWDMRSQHEGPQARRGLRLFRIPEARHAAQPDRKSRRSAAAA